MNRRGFLQLLGAGATGLVLDPERLLWVPGQKTFFLPSISLVGVDSRYTRWYREAERLRWKMIQQEAQVITHMLSDVYRVPPPKLHPSERYRVNGGLK